MSNIIKTLNTIEANIKSGEWPDKAIYYALRMNELYNVDSQIPDIIGAGCSNVIEWLIKHQSNSINGPWWADLAINYEEPKVLEVVVRNLEYFFKAQIAPKITLKLFPEMRKAVRKNSPKCLEVLIAAGATLESVGHHRYKLLVEGALYACVDALEVLLAAWPVVGRDGKGPERLIEVRYRTGNEKVQDLIEQWVREKLVESGVKDPEIVVMEYVRKHRDKWM